MKVHLLCIDPQIDFCDDPYNKFPVTPALPVTGAYDDMSRLAKMVERLAPKLDDIHITLDSHHLVDIAHPVWWMDTNGNAPDPFTVISVSDIESGIWTTRNPGFRDRSLAYVRTLAQQGNYPLCIWPPHCLIGSQGYSVHPELFAAVTNWERTRFAQVNYVTKGSNSWTEHYSAIQAEVVDPKDPSTSLNTGLLSAIAAADLIALAGEALDYCLKSTATDIFRNIDPALIAKFVLLTDASSPVDPTSGNGKAFIDEYVAKGMKLSTTDTFLL